MGTTTRSFNDLVRKARGSIQYQIQGVILEFTQDVAKRMVRQQINKSELADKLGTSPAYITKMLGGRNNFTLETMVKVAVAVDTQLRVHLQPVGSLTQWMDVMEGNPLSACGNASAEGWLEVMEKPENNLGDTGKRGPNADFSLAA